MLSRLSSHVADNLVQVEKIQQSEKELYVFGLETMFLYIWNLTTALLIGVVMGQIGECLLFHVIFMPLRTNAGGYHASSALRCYFLSTSMIILVLMILRFLPGWIPASCGLILLAAASIVIAILSPVENRNKPLDSKEKKVYGCRTRIILAAEIAIGILCYSFSWQTVFWIIVLVILLSALSLLAGQFANKFSEG